MAFKFELEIEDDDTVIVKVNGEEKELKGVDKDMVLNPPPNLTNHIDWVPDYSGVIVWAHKNPTCIWFGGQRYCW
ncbi:MAG: hypothetical protein JRD68_12580 [Deltaproteobacteria bacterium]|nr:hypothetical protein [Deltaproteobacteria bacterium]